MTEQEQALRATLTTDIPLVQWMGDPLESMPTARALLTADQQVFTNEQEQEALAFFDGGNQWPEDIAAARMELGRPCLTVNRLPLILAAMINASEDADEEPLEPDELARLKIILARRNMDAQKAFNWMWSNVAEMSKANADIARFTVGVPPK